MFQPSLAYILAEDITYCETLIHKDRATTIEDGRQVQVQSTDSEILTNGDHCWIENECMSIRDVKR